MTQANTIAQRQLLPFATNFTVTDGDLAYNTSAKCAALVEANTGSGVFSVIWSRTVPAQQIVRWGSGNSAYQLLVGKNWFAAGDAGTGFEDGILRLQISNATGTKQTTVKEFNTTLMHTQTNTSLATMVPTFDQLIPMPEQTLIAAGEDSFLQLLFKTQSPTTTVDVCDFSLSATVYQ
jgi:predicted RecA/RadA family phage recombinase